MIMSKSMQNTDPDSGASVVHVAVAVMINPSQQVLIAQRHNHVHQGGLWEFPGGKVESGESAYDALCREIREEVSVTIHGAQPLIKILHHYQDKSVLLDVWKVTAYQGEPHGAEGQSLCWQSISDLEPNLFPAANRKIIAALQLPEILLITGDFSDELDFSRRLSNALQSGVKLVQLRCKSRCDTALYLSIAGIAKDLCDAMGAKLLLNSDPDLARELNVGLHLNSHDLFSCPQRPDLLTGLLSVSCHGLNDLRQAEKLQADFVLLSPVKKTSSHPGLEGMGWNEFSRLVSTTDIPVYALGGMKLSDMQDARQSGAQGVAAISTFWSNK